MPVYFKHYGRIFVKGKRRVTCEEASYFLFHKTQKKKTNMTSTWGDFPAQTIDLFDFSVLHLSVAERLLSRSPPLRSRVDTEITDTIAKLGSIYNQKNSRSIRQMSGLTLTTASTRKLLDETLVIIPVILNRKAQGNSDVKYRRRYLELTIHSISPFFKHIVVAVVSQNDYSEMLASKLPIWQVMHIGSLASDCGLPVASVVEATRRILNEESWKNFTYVYFSEADQILLLRGIGRLFSWADNNLKAVITPHRLIITPPAFLESQNKSQVVITLLFLVCSKDRVIGYLYLYLNDRYISSTPRPFLSPRTEICPLIPATSSTYRRGT